jgi:hypothetical protein
LDAALPEVEFHFGEPFPARWALIATNFHLSDRAAARFYNKRGTGELLTKEAVGCRYDATFPTASKRTKCGYG